MDEAAIMDRPRPCLLAFDSEIFAETKNLSGGNVSSTAELTRAAEGITRI